MIFANSQLYKVELDTDEKSVLLSFLPGNETVLKFTTLGKATEKYHELSKLVVENSTPETVTITDNKRL